MLPPALRICTIHKLKLNKTWHNSPTFTCAKLPEIELFIYVFIHTVPTVVIYICDTPCSYNITFMYYLRLLCTEVYVLYNYVLIPSPKMRCILCYIIMKHYLSFCMMLCPSIYDTPCAKSQQNPKYII